jgi:hypothetical protein
MNTRMDPRDNTNSHYKKARCGVGSDTYILFLARDTNIFHLLCDLRPITDAPNQVEQTWAPLRVSFRHQTHFSICGTP